MYIIETYTYEAGVRKIKERLFELVREINLIKVLDTEEIILPFIEKQYADLSETMGAISPEVISMERERMT